MSSQRRHEFKLVCVTWRYHSHIRHVEFSQRTSNDRNEEFSRLSVCPSSLIHEIHFKIHHCLFYHFVCWKWKKENKFVLLSKVTAWHKSTISLLMLESTLSCLGRPCGSDKATPPIRIIIHTTIRNFHPIHKILSLGFPWATHYMKTRATSPIKVFNCHLCWRHLMI